MNIKEKYKKIIRDTFFFLLVFLICFHIYKHYNSMVFLGLGTKLIMVTASFGILYFYFCFLVGKKIKIQTRKVKNTKKNFVIFLIGFMFYSLFLNWVFPKLPFDEFIFFVLLLYIPMSLIFGLESRIPIVIVLVLLVFCAIFLAQKPENHADRIAIYAYYFLIIGIILLSFDYFKSLNK